MKNRLTEQEELKKFRLLTNYDSSKTLNENIQALNEQPLPEPEATAAPDAGTEPIPPANAPETETTDTNILTDEDMLGNTNKLRSYFQYFSDFGNILGLPNLFDVLGINLANIIGGRRDGVKGVVDALDGWVDVRDLTYVLTIIKALEGKCYLDDIQDPPVKTPAINRFLELYSEDEGGDDLIADVQSVGTRTLPTGAEKIKQKIVALITKLQQQSCDEQPTPAPAPTPAPTGSTGPTKIQYVPCTDFPFTVGCINEIIKKIQSCLGNLKVDGMYGPKTMAAIKQMFPDFDGKITREIYDAIMKKCAEAQGRDLSLTKLAPKTGEVTGAGKEPGKLQPRVTTPQQVFDKYKQFLQNYGGQRTKYKGADLDPETYRKLTEYLATQGYTATKTDPTKDYGAKYVWIKR